MGLERQRQQGTLGRIARQGPGLTGVLGGEALGEAIGGWIQGLMPGFAYAGAVGKALAMLSSPGAGRS